MAMKKYERVANAIKQQIKAEIFRTGQKLPSIRHLSSAHGVSISTIQEAFALLEREEWVEVRPKSGHYVRQPRNYATPSVPTMSQYAAVPREVSRWAKVLHVLFRHEEPGVTYLGRATPDVAVPTLRPLQRSLAALTRQADSRSLSYDYIFGCEELRQQICRIAVDGGCGLSPQDIVVTSGCQESLSCSLRALTEPGDTVVVDSPSFYGSLQAIAALNLRALEIPTDPRLGISLEALELALEQWSVKACLLTPTFNNPLGYSMPDERKIKLLELLAQFDIPLIEDDIYGDLAYQLPRPRTIKSFDRDGRVILCSSFSKSLAPGLRVGWVAPGRYVENVMHMKYVSSMSTATLPQLAIAEFISRGGYDRHVRKICAQYQTNRDQMLEWIGRFFPNETRATCPDGGFLVWVELPERVDTDLLTDMALEQGVGIAAGSLFTAAAKYGHHIRLSYANCATQQTEKAVRRLGELVKNYPQ
jgi:DNA-binding transcriptional MocR family regulator